MARRETVFDELLCFLSEPMFQIPVRSFMDENCISTYIYIDAVASRPTAGQLGHVLADRQSVVQADGQPGPAQRQVAGKISVLTHR